MLVFRISIGWLRRWGGSVGVVGEGGGDCDVREWEAEWSLRSRTMPIRRRGAYVYVAAMLRWSTRASRSIIDGCLSPGVKCLGIGSAPVHACVAVWSCHERRTLVGIGHDGSRSRQTK